MIAVRPSGLSSRTTPRTEWFCTLVIVGVADDLGARCSRQATAAIDTTSTTTRRISERRETTLERRICNSQQQTAAAIHRQDVKARRLYSSIVKFFLGSR